MDEFPTPKVAPLFELVERSTEMFLPGRAVVLHWSIVPPDRVLAFGR